MATSAAYIDFDEGAAPSTPASGKVRQYAKTDGKLYQKDDSGTETDLAAAGGSGGVTFKRTVADATGNMTTTSTSKVAIDTTDLAYLTLDLEVGDVVRCSLTATIKHSGTVPIGFDFEVDRPTSGDTFVGASSTYGCQVSTPGINRQAVQVTGFWTCAEAGVHGFRPAWLTDSGTATLCNATSGNDDVMAQFSVENLGAPAA